MSETTEWRELRPDLFREQLDALVGAVVRDAREGTGPRLTDSVEALLLHVGGQLFAVASDRDALRTRYAIQAAEAAHWEAKACELQAENDALRADAKRLDWLADEPPFDALGDMDVHEAAFDVASEEGREEATAADYRFAIRRVIDAARFAAIDAAITRTEEASRGE